MKNGIQVSTYAQLPALTSQNVAEWLPLALEIATATGDIPERVINMAKTAIRLRSSLDMWYAACEMQEAITLTSS